VTRAIDVMHLGRERVICAHEIDGLVIDPGPASCLDALLAGLGDTTPRALLLTHVHLDHAGASGVLVRRFPELVVYVHELGAPHLVDPSKLVASASRLYGDDMERMWGEVAPVPEANVRALSGGEVAAGFRVEYTPGHASHHVCYLHEETGEAYVGDMAGVRIPPGAAREHRERLHSKYLLFESNFNGLWHSYIEAFSYVFPKGMRALWGSSYGFPGPVPVGPFKQWVRRNEFVASHYYSAYPEASTREVLAALELKAMAEALARQAESSSPAEFRNAYHAFLEGAQRCL